MQDCIKAQDGSKSWNDRSAGWNKQSSEQQRINYSVGTYINATQQFSTITLIIEQCASANDENLL